MSTVAAVEGHTDRLAPRPLRDPCFGNPEPIDTEAVPGAAPQFTIEPFIGHRIWRLVPGTMAGDRPEHPLLQSATRTLIWEGPTVEASCLRRRRAMGPHTGEPGPALGCACGIYALKRPQPPPRPWVWAQGRIALSGRVLEGALGYRANRGRVLGPMRMIIGAADPQCLQPMCSRPATWMRIGPRVYLPRCDAHLRPENRQITNLALDEFLRHAAVSFAERYGVEMQGE